QPGSQAGAADVDHRQGAEGPRLPAAAPAPVRQRDGSATLARRAARHARRAAEITCAHRIERHLLMTLNHLNLTVVSPDETSAFLAKYFDLEPRGGNAGIQMLSDDKGMVLTLIKARAEDRDQGPGVRDQGSESHSDQGPGASGQGPERVRYPSSFHI